MSDFELSFIRLSIQNEYIWNLHTSSFYCGHINNDLIDDSLEINYKRMSYEQ